MAKAGATAKDIAAIGITNQRETTILWDRKTGQPVANAIVWQSRVSAPICEKLKADGKEELFRSRTGLVVDAYFSGTKIKHLLDTIPGLRARAEKGEILFGTVDTFLLAAHGRRVHVTDPSNASRTLLTTSTRCSGTTSCSRSSACPRPAAEVKSSSRSTGRRTRPARGASRSPATRRQQAATFGQACFTPARPRTRTARAASCSSTRAASPWPRRTACSRRWAGRCGKVTYCLEGSVFIAGAVVQWLRDGLKVIATSPDVEALARAVPDSDGVYLVPAFVGLGAPYWDPYARGTIIGLTRNTTVSHVARAALDSMAFQTRDVLEAMQRDAGLTLDHLKVDGGAAANNLLLQFQADVLGVAVRRPVVSETTALGAAYLAGLAVGYWKDTDDVVNNWALDREFTPAMPAPARDGLYGRWQKAVALAGLGRTCGLRCGARRGRHRRPPCDRVGRPSRRSHRLLGRPRGAKAAGFDYAELGVRNFGPRRNAFRALRAEGNSRPLPRRVSLLPTDLKVSVRRGRGAGDGIRPRLSRARRRWTSTPSCSAAAPRVRRRTDSRASRPSRSSSRSPSASLPRRAATASSSRWKRRGRRRRTSSTRRRKRSSGCVPWATRISR
jgi:glycerol kinase